MRSIKQYAIVAAVALLVGCGGDPPPEQGYVRDKQFEPAHWEGGYRYETYQDCGIHLDMAGEMTFGCEPATRSVYDPQHEWVRDRWRLKLEECKLNDKGERKCRSGWLEVGEEAYNAYSLGNHYPKPA